MDHEEGVFSKCLLRDWALPLKITLPPHAPTRCSVCSEHGAGDGDDDKRWGGIATSLLASVQIQVLSFVYSKVVMRLNDFENYQTETAYEDNLIFKTFLFQVRLVHIAWN